MVCFNNSDEEFQFCPQKNALGIKADHRQRYEFMKKNYYTMNQPLVKVESSISTYILPKLRVLLRVEIVAIFLRYCIIFATDR